MKHLKIQVFSGLGSRMRAVIGAIAWAKNNNATVGVCWPRIDKSEELGEFPVWFSELFDSPLPESQMERPETGGRYWPKSPGVTSASKDGEYLCRTCDPATIIDEDMSLDGWPYTEMWKPASEVESHFIEIPNRTVGVHIRHSLAQPGAQGVEWYISRMREIESEYDTGFFLSCDAIAVEEQVKAEFPDVIHIPKDYKYDNLGIKKTAADLFLLQRCDWMLGSYQSSFSELAGWMRGGEYLSGWGREGWLPGGRYEDSKTSPVGIDEALL